MNHSDTRSWLRRSLTAGLIQTLLALTAVHCAAAWIEGPRGEQVFMRAVGYSGFHADHDLPLPPREQAADRKLVQNLEANCILTWGPTTFEEIADWHGEGIYTLPQVVYTPPRRSVFAGGQPAPVPIYVNEENRRGFRTEARDMAAALSGNPGVLAVSLGNQYAWSAFTPDLGFSYAAFEAETVNAFRAALKPRFSTADQFRNLTGLEVRSVEDALPPVGLTSSPVMWEWWRFMTDALAGYLGQGAEGLRAVGWNVPITYAQPTGKHWDPASEGPAPPFLDAVSGNVFFDHTRDWSLFCTTLARIIGTAQGRPVLVTEVGAHTFNRDENLAARILKQSMALVLLHPEVAGVGVYEFADDWQRSGRPEIQSVTDDHEHWGLLTAQRKQKRTYHATREMFSLIRRNEALFKHWQAPPAVLLSAQDLDWWRLRGPDGTIHRRVAAELYRQGIPFRIVSSTGLRDLDPAENPRLILCDTYLPVNPDRSGDAKGRLISYLEHGGNMLYLSRNPWQRAYGESTPPRDLRLPADGAPISRGYGDGHVAIVPTTNLDAHRLRFLLQDYVNEHLPHRPVLSVRPRDEGEEVFWRVFQAEDGLWLWVVNTGAVPVPRVDITLGPGIDPGRIRLHASDRARLSTRRSEVALTNLDVYALVRLGVPAPLPEAPVEAAPEPPVPPAEPSPPDPPAATPPDPPTRVPEQLPDPEG